ncbi:MAG: queuosine precursor transporter [Defluviitaleaceae bacterium]|nr:queuosine precursor transporter [Defluviitaleaceae bacterium]
MINEDSRVMSPLLMYLSVVFVAMLLISNVISNHMIVFIRWTIDAGTITFPITYIISDVLSEVYGYKWARRVAWTSLAINAVFALIILTIVRLPSPQFYLYANADEYGVVHFAHALANSWRIVLASLVAYCIGDLADDRIFRHLREKNRVKYAGKENMKGFAFRALASSLVGHILDTNIFVFIAFAPVAFLTDTGVPWGALPEMIAVGIILKWAYEWAIIPITFRVTKWVHKKEEK